MCQQIDLKVRQHGTQVLGDEPEYSSCHGRVIATLDYIWYSERAFAPGALAVRPSGHHTGSHGSINGWSPVRSIASPMDSIKESSSSTSAGGLGKPGWQPTRQEHPQERRQLSDRHAGWQAVRAEWRQSSR